MKKLLTTLFIVAYMATVSVFTVHAQETKKGYTVIVPDISKMVIEQGNDEVRIEFMVKDMYSGTSTKPYTERATSFPEIKKFSIKNFPDQQGLRQCYVVANKENYELSLSKVFNILEVKKFMVGNETTDFQGFFSKIKK